MKKLYLIAGGVFLLAGGVYIYLRRQANILKDFSWKIKGFKVRSFSFSNLSLQVTFLFTSKADVEATIKKMYFDIYVQGKNVGFIKEEKQFIIPANGSSEVPLYISVNPQAVFKNIIDVTLLSAQSKDVMFTLDGYVNVKSGFISTTIPVKYETSIKQYLGIVPSK